MSCGSFVLAYKCAMLWLPAPATHKIKIKLIKSVNNNGSLTYSGYSH